MLAMPARIMLVHAVTVAVVALALSGLSVGLGACLPNFRETDPSKIAVGFGGTLNLVAGLALLILVIGLMALPAHVWLGRPGLAEETWPAWLWALAAAGAGAGLTAAWLAMRLGAARLRTMEF
jgi:ABC-2 type transport system permease protein